MRFGTVDDAWPDDDRWETPGRDDTGARLPGALTASARLADATSRSSLVGAGLSFLWPGLGQWYLGRSRSALVYAAPMALIALLLGAQLAAGLTAFAVRLLDPNFSLTLLILVLLLGGWRLLAIVDAALPGARSAAGWSRRSLAWMGLLLALVVGMHGFVAYYTYAFYQAGSAIFVGDPPGSDQPIAGGSNGASPTPTDDYNVPPFETPATERDRVTILLTGVDKNTERTHSLTDTMLVVSIEPETGAVVMVSFPRDIAEFPLYGGGTYFGKINSLMSYAAGHPKQFPDGPLPTLAKELGYLLGLPINYFAAVDLDGFQYMIDAVGGVTVNVERGIADPAYNWLDGTHGFYLSAGKHKLDGRLALAFVRSRQGAGDNDFTRADRQQQLLLALRTKLTKPQNLDKLPAVLDAAAKTVRTNFPPERLDEIIQLAQLESSAINRVVLQPPKYSVHPPTNTTGGTYILRIKWDAIRALSVRLFAEDSAFWSGQFDESGTPVPLPAP